MEHKKREIDIFFEDNDRYYTFVTPIIENEIEYFSISVPARMLYSYIKHKVAVECYHIFTKFGSEIDDIEIIKDLLEELHTNRLITIMNRCKYYRKRNPFTLEMYEVPARINIDIDFD